MKVSRKEILNDPNWLKFKPLVFDSSEKQIEFDKEHISKGHLVDNTFYGVKQFRKDKVKLVNCWTCRITGAFGFYDNNAKDDFVIKEHWLYNDFPDSFQNLIMPGEN